MIVRYFECSCESSDHVLRVSHDPDEEIKSLLYVETHLKNLSFFKRLWLAIKYIFGFQSKYGHWEEYLWDKGTALKM